MAHNILETIKPWLSLALLCWITITLALDKHYLLATIFAFFANLDIRTSLPNKQTGEATLKQFTGKT